MNSCSPRQTFLHVYVLIFYVRVALRSKPFSQQRNDRLKVTSKKIYAIKQKLDFCYFLQLNISHFFKVVIMTYYNR